MRALWARGQALPVAQRSLKSYRSLMTEPYDPKPTVDALVAELGVDGAAWSLLRDAQSALRAHVPMDSGLLLELREMLSRRKPGEAPRTASHEAAELLLSQALRLLTSELSGLKDRNEAISLLKSARVTERLDARGLAVLAHFEKEPVRVEIWGRPGVGVGNSDVSQVHRVPTVEELLEERARQVYRAFAGSERYLAYNIDKHQRTPWLVDALTDALLGDANDGLTAIVDLEKAAVLCGPDGWRPLDRKAVP
jgi:hypothetical protein